MRRLQPEKAGNPDYCQIWRVVDGAVAQALDAHPEYLAPGVRVRTVRNSIVKRVTGAINGYAEQSAWVRSGSGPADATGPALCLKAGPDAALTASSAVVPRDARAGGAGPSPAAPIPAYGPTHYPAPADIHTRDSLAAWEKRMATLEAGR